jgi:hypothetical protein
MTTIGLKYQPITDLSGGMVTNYNYTKVARNQYKRLLNADLYTDGSVNTRKGREKLITTPFVGNPTINSLSIIGQSNSGDFILGQGGTVFDELSTGTAVPVRTGLTEGALLSTVNFDNYLFCVNGTDTPFMTQGAMANTYRVGIVATTNLTGFTVAASAGGDGTDGIHRVTFRYRSTITGARSNSYISGDVIQSTTVTLGGGSNTYSITFPVGLVSSDAQVDIIDYFAQEAGAVESAPYFYLGSSANSASTYTFGSDVSDDDLIVLERLDIDDDPAPSSLRSITEYRGRLFAVQDDYNVAFSKQRIDPSGFVNLPTSWPPDNLLEVGYGDGDPLQAVILFADYVFAFKRRSVWILVGDINSSNFGFRRLKTNIPNIGLLNKRAATVAGDRIYFVTDDLKFQYFGMTDFSTTELRLPIIPPSSPISDLFITFAAAYRNNVNVVNFTFGQLTQIWIAFSDGASGLSASNNFNVFVYDYTANNGNGAWGIHTGIEVASSVLARDNNGDYYVFTGDYYGYVWKNNTTDGDGAIINGTSTGSNTVTTFNDTDSTFASDEIGCFIRIISGTGQDQIRRITSLNSATQYGVTPDWDTVPDNTSVYTVGGINFQLWSRDDWCDEGAPPDFDKYGWYLDIDFDTSPNEDGGNYGFEVYLTVDRSQSLTNAVVRNIESGGSFWGSAIWGESIWSEPLVNFGQIGFDLYFKQISHRIINGYAGQPLKINGWTYTYQQLYNLRSQ